MSLGAVASVRPNEVVLLKPVTCSDHIDRSVREGEGVFWIDQFGLSIAEKSEWFEFVRISA